MELINETIGSYTKRIFNKFSNKEALVYVEDGRRFAYKELNDEIEMISKRLVSMGIKKGEHVALVSSNSPEWIITFLSILKIGAVCVCINYALTQEEIDYMIKQSESKILIVNEDDMTENIDIEKFTYIKLMLKIRDLYNENFDMEQVNKITESEMCDIYNSVEPDDVATILYTSGTTGNPKGILFNHKSIINGPLSFLENFKYTSKDSILAPLPLNHILGGLYTVFLGLYAGSKVVLMKKFKTSLALEAIENEECTGIHGVPTMYQYLLNRYSSYDVSSLRVGMVAGAVCTKTLMQRIMEDLGISEINNTFGQTETLGVTQTTVYDKGDRKISTVGKPVAHVEIKICDLDTRKRLPVNSVGELCVKSPYTMIGYYKNPLATSVAMQDNWVRTGDVACVDEDGFLSIRGRIKDLIIRGGENISPSEIEQCLVKYKKIESAVVVGISDEVQGEEIFAFIRPAKDSVLNQNEIIEYLDGKLAKYKFPKYIEFTKSYPLTSNGKIARNVLRQMAEEKINNYEVNEEAVD